MTFRVPLTQVHFGAYALVNFPEPGERPAVVQKEETEAA